MNKPVPALEVSDISGETLCVYYNGHEQCAPGHTFGPAERNHHLLHFVAHGSGRLKNAFGSFEVQAGSAFYIAPGETTVYGTGKSDPWEYYWIGFGGSAADKLLETAGISSEHPVAACDITLIRRICREMDEHCSCSACDRLMLTSRMYEVFACLTAHNRPRRSSGGRDYVSKALEYMRETAYYDISVQSIADYMGLDRSHLYRLVRAQTGKSIKEHLLYFRLERAKELLKSTGYGVAQIGAACGFEDGNHFSKLFRERTGVTPTQYRREHTAVSADNK